MISIGIAAYNEESSIGECLSYLKNQLEEANLLKNSEIIVCLNGCNDKTGKIVKKFKKNSLNKLRIIHAKKGKLNAHKKILEKISHKNQVLFCDADVLVPKETILAIIETLNGENNVRVASGYPFTLKPWKIS
ncbi:MAG TPA: glycosyltransferase family A protein, partial [Candidatus Nanoarchaeia archaeon]|nr:glycosyltransferase family A protein [Candidatus Nanoarchaeia archaeon]